MPRPIRMPKPGQMTEECTVVLWHRREGDAVLRGDVLFEIETDKATMEVEAFDAGTLLRIVVPEGSTVPVNSICAWVGEAGETIPEEPPLAGSGLEGVPADLVEASGSVLAGSGSLPPKGDPPVALAADGAVERPSVGSTSFLPNGGRLRISPRAARLAAELGLDMRRLAGRGSGPDGRIVERDVRSYEAASRISSTPGGPDARLASAVPLDHGAPAPSPEFGAARPETFAAGWSAAAPAQASEEESPRPLSRLRRVIAERLTESWTTIPQFSVTVAADVTALLALRDELRAAGERLSVTDFVLAATAQTLVEFPDVNARTDGITVHPSRRVHLGLAVAIPGGLLVPVLRDADRASVAELHARAAALAERARAGRLTPDELTGSTFTISNLGMFGVEEFRAIVNPGEAGILAVASALPTPVALAGGLAVRSVMRLTLTADHRIVDGELGARFVNAIRRRLEDAESFRALVASG